MNDAARPEGLRQRKRAATHARIETAALALAVEHGYEQVTVDMICAESMVSQRTFFNYFGSKEGVILGCAAPMPSAEAIAVFVHRRDGTLLGDFLALLGSAAFEAQPDPEVLRARRMLIHRTPELITKELARMGELENQFTQIVLERLRAQGPAPGSAEQPAHQLEDEAQMVIGLAMGVLRFVMRKWFSEAHSGTNPEMLQYSLELIRRITSSEPG